MAGIRVQTRGVSEDLVRLCGVAMGGDQGADYNTDKRSL